MPLSSFEDRGFVDIYRVPGTQLGMANYKFRCSNCDHETTVTAAIKDYEEHDLSSTSCVQCGGAVRRVFERFDFRMKA
jgi:putative FmdB family regulatory protein